jgi:hypothetical protein
VADIIEAKKEHPKGIEYGGGEIYIALRIVHYSRINHVRDLLAGFDIQPHILYPYVCVCVFSSCGSILYRGTHSMNESNSTRCADFLIFE